MKYLFFIFFSFAIFWEGTAQDSLKLASQFSVDLKGKHVLSALTNSPIECINCPLGAVSDNPLHHFAIYTGINYTGILADKHSFKLGLYLEERSFSGGNNTLSNLVIFPRIEISSSDRFKIGENVFQYQVSAGDFWDKDFDDILRFYNIDFHGLQLKLAWNKFFLGFHVIGDLSRNIGFDLHELYKFTAEYRSEKFINVSSLSINELFDSPRGTHPVPRDINLSNYTTFPIFKEFQLESQIELRYNQRDNISMALGAKLSYRKENLAFVSGIRYYQANFNEAYKSFKPRYRIGNRYVGTQLYPLKNYYRPINQWALLTNYQNQDLINWELRFDWNTKIYKKLRFLSEIDFNLIYNINDDDLDYYPFYDIGFSINFLKNFVFAITGTNKHMNLDSFFETSYASKLPLLSYSFKMDINQIKLKPIYIKY